MQMRQVDISDTTDLDLKVSISLTKCRWAKMRLLKHYERDINKKFAIFENYAKELSKSNKGSSVILETEKYSQVLKGCTFVLLY